MTWGRRGYSATSPAVRRLVLATYGDVCYICGGPLTDEVEHVVPRSDGGTDDLSNLRPVHDMPCHRNKTAQEGNRARWKFRRNRAPEQHPGIIEQGEGM